MTTVNEWEIARVLLSGYGAVVGCYLLVAALADWKRLRDSDLNGRALLMLQGRSLADGMALVAQVCLLLSGIHAIDTPPAMVQAVHLGTGPGFAQGLSLVASGALLVSSLGRAWLRRRIR